MFEGTIRTNLLYAAPDATEGQIRRALEAADLATSVDAMPLGLETPVGERGISLSGGQRQRLAPARALVAGPALLLLDDSTSALDADTEASVCAALERLSPRRTCLIVSHTVTSLVWADRIIVLDCGKILEQETHDEMIALGGHYAEAHRYQTRIMDVHPPHAA